MGEKGARSSPEVAELAERVVEKLKALDGITARPMFGGYGLFADGQMFGIVSSDVELFFKENDANRELFEAARSHRHGKMPYYSVPARVLRDVAALRRWATRSLPEPGPAKAKPKPATSKRRPR